MYTRASLPHQYKIMKRIISNIGQWTDLSLLVAERWQKKPKPFMVILKAAPKTHSQLGYLHSTVLPLLTISLHEAGEIKRKSEREAKYWLKALINYGEWIEYNGSVVFDPSSFEAADTEVLSDAIDKAITEAASRGYYIPAPTQRKLCIQ